MRINQITESRDMCNVCGQTPCNCTHLTEHYDAEYDDEAGMAETNLNTIARAAQGLLDTIDDHENLPEWVQEKIAKVEGMIVAAWDYLKSQEEQGIDPVQDLTEFAPASNPGGGNYLLALASAWYNGTFKTGNLHKGIKSQEDVERILERGIHCGDGKIRKYSIGYNAEFDGVEIQSDDHYEYADYDDAGRDIDSRTGQPWGPYDVVAFGDDDLDESLNGQQGVAEGSLEEIDRRGFLKGVGAAAVAGAGGGANADRSWGQDEFTGKWKSTMNAENFSGAYLNVDQDRKLFRISLVNPVNFTPANIQKGNLHYPKITSAKVGYKWGGFPAGYGQGKVGTLPAKQFGNYVYYYIDVFGNMADKMFNDIWNIYLDSRNDKFIFQIEIDNEPTTLVFKVQESDLQQLRQQQQTKESVSQGVAEGHDSEDLANEVYAEFERSYPNLARRAHERTIHAAIMDVLNYGGDSNPSALAQDVARAVKRDMQQGMAEGQRK